MNDVEPVERGDFYFWRIGEDITLVIGRVFIFWV